MNWIIYVVLSVIKLLLIGGLVSIFILLTPVIFLLLSFGIALSYLRDVESKVGAEKFPLIALENIFSTYLKSAWLYLSVQITRIQHMLMARDKTIF